MSLRVVIIDDDPVNLDLMTYLLTAFGHRPFAADGVERALAWIGANPIDIVLCDIQMPQADGFEFLRRLDELQLRTMPVIGVTALAMVGDREKVLAAGFDGYMAKPIEPETFVREIEAFLEPARRSEDVAPSREHASAAAPAEPRAPTPRKNINVIVVDNVEANREIMRVLLDYAGYDVFTAPGAHEALRIARRVNPRVILSDIHMPDGNGFDLLREIGADPALQGIATILVSSSAQRGAEIEQAIALGASCCLLLPVEPDVLLNTVSRLLTNAEATQ